MRERFLHLLKPTAIVLAIGFTYYIIRYFTGFTIHCPFRQYLGIYCPGCGVSKMLQRLIHFRFSYAFSHNCVVFCLLPVFLIEGIYRAYRYIRYGDKKLSKAENIGVYVVIGILIVFGIVRNIWQIDILVP